jgi:hypothetical protein
MTIGRLPSVEGGIQPTIFDAKADILTATANDTPARLAVGANDTVLTADSATATGLKWAAPASGGKVLQVVYGTSATSPSSSSATYADTGLTATITPSADTSKILVKVFHPDVVISTNNTGLDYRLVRGATTINQVLNVGSIGSNTATKITTIALNNLDSPATTSATTYKTTFASDAGNASVQLNGFGTGTATMILLEIGA